MQQGKKEDREFVFGAIYRQEWCLWHGSCSPEIGDTLTFSQLSWPAALTWAHVLRENAELCQQQQQQREFKSSRRRMVNVTIYVYVHTETSDLHCGTGGIVSTWLQLLNSRSDYPATITPPPSSQAFTKATKTCQTNTRACAPSLRCRAYFQPSTNVQLADTNVLQTAQREPKKARQQPVHSSTSKTNLTLTREKYDRLWNTDKDRNVSVVLTKATILAIFRNSFLLKGQILLQ